MPPVAEGLDEQEILDLVREGLRENAVELALQPIVSLPQRKRRFFECFSRVRTARRRGDRAGAVSRRWRSATAW